MKNILVLGGAGTMGSEIVNELIKRSDAKITIADANTKKLDKAASVLGERVDTSVIDADDFDNLVQLMKKADVVVSSIGPFYKYATKLVEASIAARVNFLDIDDDFDATQQALCLHEEARKAGVTAIIGCGASPGVTNILAKYGADKMDRVHEIRIFWAESATNPTGPAAMVHWFHITAEDVPMFQDGDWVNVKGLSEPEFVEFAPPMGKLEVYYTGHPEPVTLPRYIKGLKKASIKGAIYPHGMMELYRHLTQAGFGSAADFVIKEHLSMPLRELSVGILRAMPHFAPQFFRALYQEESEKYPGCAGATKVEVIGEKGAEEVQYVYDMISDSVRGGTAKPAAIGALMLLDGKVKVTGVLAPEGAFDPGLFLSELSKETQVCETEIRVRKIE